MDKVTHWYKGYEVDMAQDPRNDNSETHKIILWKEEKCEVTLAAMETDWSDRVSHLYVTRGESPRDEKRIQAIKNIVMEEPWDNSGIGKKEWAKMDVSDRIRYLAIDLGEERNVDTDDDNGWNILFIGKNDDPCDINFYELAAVHDMGVGITGTLLTWMVRGKDIEVEHMSAYLEFVWEMAGSKSLEAIQRDAYNAERVMCENAGELLRTQHALER